MVKPKTLRQYAGELCKREGGKSQAKIGDVVQILNMVADDLFRKYAETICALNGVPPTHFAEIKEIARTRAYHRDVKSTYDTLMAAGARRYLAKLLAKKKKRK